MIQFWEHSVTSQKKQILFFEFGSCENSENQVFTDVFIIEFYR